MEAKAAQRSLSLSETKTTVFSWRFGAETRQKKDSETEVFYAQVLKHREQY